MTGNRLQADSRMAGLRKRRLAAFGRTTPPAALRQECGNSISAIRLVRVPIAREVMPNTLLRLSAALAALLLLPAIAIGSVCGDANGKPGTNGHFISLPAKPPEPFFYYRLDDYVVLMRPKDVLAQLNAWSERPINRHSDATALRLRIVNSLPLRENKDLYSYILHDPGLWTQTRWLLIELLEGGKAAVIDTGGNALQRVYVRHDQQKYSVATIIQLGKSRKSFQLIWQLQCIADPLPSSASNTKPQ